MSDLILTEEEKTSMEYLSIATNIISSCWRIYNTDSIFYGALAAAAQNTKAQEIVLRQQIASRLNIKPTFSFKEGEIVEYEQ